MKLSKENFVINRISVKPFLNRIGYSLNSRLVDLLRKKYRFTPRFFQNQALIHLKPPVQRLTKYQYHYHQAGRVIKWNVPFPPDSLKVSSKDRKAAMVTLQQIQPLIRLTDGVVSTFLFQHRIQTGKARETFQRKPDFLQSRKPVGEEGKPIAVHALNQIVNRFFNDTGQLEPGVSPRGMILQYATLLRSMKESVIRTEQIESKALARKRNLEKRELWEKKAILILKPQQSMTEPVPSKRAEELRWPELVQRKSTPPRQEENEDIIAHRVEITPSTDGGTVTVAAIPRTELEAIADQVYHLLEWRISVETDRRGLSFDA